MVNRFGCKYKEKGYSLMVALCWWKDDSTNDSKIQKAVDAERSLHDSLAIHKKWDSSTYNTKGGKPNDAAKCLHMVYVAIVPKQ